MKPHLISYKVVPSLFNHGFVMLTLFYLTFNLNFIFFIHFVYIVY